MQTMTGTERDKRDRPGLVPVRAVGRDRDYRDIVPSHSLVPVPDAPSPGVCPTQSVPLDSHPWRHRNNRIPTPVAKLLLVGLLWLLWAVCCPNCCWGAV